MMNAGHTSTFIIRYSLFDILKTQQLSGWSPPIRPLNLCYQKRKNERERTEQF